MMEEWPRMIEHFCKSIIIFNQYYRYDLIKKRVFELDAVVTKLICFQIIKNNQ